MRNGLYHGRRPLGFALTRQVVGYVAPGTAGRLRLSPPHLRQEQPLVYEGIPMS